jgi:hypothetical protein
VSAPLLASFSVSGGSPPPTLESLRVLADGHARAIVAGAWPHGSPQDEAGVYECELDADQLERVREYAAHPELRAQAGEHGPIRADSGRASIKLGDDDTRIAWGAFVTPAPVVADTVATLRDILAAVRRHPVAAVRMALLATGDGLELELSNPGTEPVGVSLLRPRVAAFDGAGPPPLSVYHEAAELDPVPDMTLASGERRRVAVATPFGAPAVAFATVTLDLPDSAPLDGFLVSRPT